MTTLCKRRGITLYRRFDSVTKKSLCNIVTTFSGVSKKALSQLCIATLLQRCHAIHGCLLGMLYCSFVDGMMQRYGNVW